MEEKLKDEIAKLEEEYQQLNSEINNTVEKYNNTIRQIQAEGQAVVDDLRIKREGKYQTIESLKNLLNPSEESNKTTVKQEEESTKKTSKKDSEKSKTEKKVTKSVSDVPKNDNVALTPDEMTNLQSILDTPNKLNIAKPSNLNESDIPDYLKDEYKQ